MKKVVIFLISIIIINTRCFSQKDTVAPATLNVTGGYKTISYIHFEWSIGEATSIETMASSSRDIFVTNGILQPLSEIPNNNRCWGDDELKIYPNPTRDWVNIVFLSTQTGKITLSLFDAMGRLMKTKQFNYSGLSHIEPMDLSQYASGIYFLYVYLEPTGASVIKDCPGKKILKIN